MKIIKKDASSFDLNPAHDGAGTKKVLIADGEIKNIQGITKSCLTPGGMFAWHCHEDCNECMFVLASTGTVRDQDGIYPFEPGDLFVFPQGVYHEIKNTGTELFKAIYIRTK